MGLDGAENGITQSIISILKYESFDVKVEVPMEKIEIPPEQELAFEGFNDEIEQVLYGMRAQEGVLHEFDCDVFDDVISLIVLSMRV